MVGLDGCSLVHALFYSFTYLLIRSFICSFKKGSPKCHCASEFTIRMEGVPGITHHIPALQSHCQAGN